MIAYCQKCLKVSLVYPLNLKTLGLRLFCEGCVRKERKDDDK